MRFLKTNPHNNVGNTAYGNAQKLHFVLSTDSTGKVLGANTLAAFNKDDEVALGILPAGMRLHDSLANVTTPLSATTTMTIGFKYVDGIDDTNVPQDAAYFGAGLVVDTAGRLRNATTKPSVRLPKDAYLVVKLNVANNTKASRTEVTIDAAMEG